MREHTYFVLNFLFGMFGAFIGIALPIIVILVLLNFLEF